MKEKRPEPSPQGPLPTPSESPSKKPLSPELLYFPFCVEINSEIITARKKFPAFHSLHEGYAVLLEEVDELWQHVKIQNTFRNKKQIHDECIQIAAMACRIIIDLEKNNYTE